MSFSRLVAPKTSMSVLAFLLHRLRAESIFSCTGEGNFPWRSRGSNCWHTSTRFCFSGTVSQEDSWTWQSETRQLKMSSFSPVPEAAWLPTREVENIRYCKPILVVVGWGWCKGGLPITIVEWSALVSKHFPVTRRCRTQEHNSPFGEQHWVILSYN